MARTKQAGTAHNSGAAALQAAPFQPDLAVVDEITTPGDTMCAAHWSRQWAGARCATVPLLGPPVVLGERLAVSALGLSGVGGARRALREPSVRLIHQTASWRGVQRVAGSARR